MLSLPPSVRIYLCTAPTDMRRGFDGLAALARDVLQQDPLSGHLFVFCNKRADRVKILYWDRSGFCLWYKRIEKGRFHFPDGATASVQLEAAELALLLEGIQLQHAVRRPRFIPRSHAAASA
jgi:transposase